MKRLLGIFAIAMLGGVVALGINNYFFTSSSEPQSIEERQQVRFTNQELIESAQSDFVEVASRSTPTVVHIKTTRVALLYYPRPCGVLWFVSHC